MTDEILSAAELEALSAPLSCPTPFAVWIEAERVARAFSEDVEADLTVGEAERFAGRQRVAARVRRAVRNRAAMVARAEVEAAGRRARAVFATLRADR